MLLEVASEITESTSEFNAGGKGLTTLQSLIDDIRSNVGDPKATVYLGVFRSAARVVVPENRSTIYGLRGDFGRLYLIAESVFADGLPMHLRYLTVSCAPSLETAAYYLYNATARVQTVLQIATNAGAEMIQETLLLERKYGEKTDFCRETPFYGIPKLPLNGRELVKEAAAALINRLWGHPDGSRITRAMVQYETALGHYRDDGRPLALMHLYMGAEALTDAVIRQELNDLSITREQLMTSLGVVPGKSTSETMLRARVRLHRIFQGDSDTYQRAREFSDALEHGFGDETVIWGVPSDTHRKTARYLREAIVRILKVPADVELLLLRPPYDEILTSGEMPHYFTRCLSDEMNWRRREFTVIGLQPQIVRVDYDAARREYTPVLEFPKPPESAP